MTHPTFGERLQSARAARGPLCVGIDPHRVLLRDWGLPDDADGLARFAGTVVDAVADQAAMLKPQSAFFERHGARGIAVLENTVRAARAAGALVVLDVKRGDIGSTAEAYADAYLHPSAPLAADALTVSPYLGFGSLRPFLDAARTHRAGVFVLARTSNPEGAAVQQARIVREDIGGGGISTTVAVDVLSSVRAENAGHPGPGSIGCVVGVGSAVGDSGSGQLSRRDLDVGGPLLVPGLGAQGGTPDDVRRLFAGVEDQVWPAVSRSVLAAGPDRRALRAAVRRHRDELADVLDV